MALRVSSEVGRLRTVMLHRPGPELLRLTPRNNDALLFDGIPWVERAQEEHDGFADVLRAPWGSMRFTSSTRASMRSPSPLGLTFAWRIAACRHANVRLTGGYGVGVWGWVSEW